MSDLYQIVYTSQAARSMTRGELSDMLIGARTRNAPRDVTGLLVYDAGAFLQVLEGERATVESLFDRIRDDPRHVSVHRLAAGPIDHRLFDGWTMGWFNLADFEEVDVSDLRAHLASDDPDLPTIYRLFVRFRELLADGRGGAR